MKKDNSRVFYMTAIYLGLIILILFVFFRVIFAEETPKKQREISVILYSVENNGWEAFQEGLKQAEDDYSVNISLVILREGGDGAEQFEIIKKEIENGAEGIIVAVTDYEAMYNSLLEKSFSIPIVSVESGLGDGSFPLISADNYEMGKRLGEEILKDFSEEEALTVALTKETVRRDSVKQREQGLRDALQGKAKIISLGAAVNGEGAHAAVALQKDSLLALTERTDPALKDTKYYGIGSTASTVAALDQGKLEKLVFQNEFNMGYLAVKKLLEEVEGNGESEMKEIDYYCVSRQELYGTQYEHLLFPIVE